MATLPIHLEIEDVAVGPVLVLLKRTPGVISIRLPFLEQKPTPVARANGLNIEQTVVQLFAKHHGGPLVMEVVQTEIGGNKTRAYGAIHNLKKKGILVLVGKGEYKFSAKAMHMMQKGASPEATASPLALPKPHSHHAKGNGKTKIVKTASGRAKQGAGPAALRELLSEKGPMKVIDIKDALNSKGVSAKSVSGIVDRGKRDGLIKKLTSGEYELTAKGRQSTEAQQPSIGA